MSKFLEFTKLQGAGNDFIIIEDLKGAINLTSENIRWLCDRHFGIGADGLMLVQSPRNPEADFFMFFYNPDGTVAEMCGNGIRCFAKYLYEHCLTNQKKIKIETLGGVKGVQLIFDGTDVSGAKVDMGKFSFKKDEIPVIFEKETVIDEKIRVAGQSFNVTCVSMGNPHCVIFVEEISRAPVNTIGPKIEKLKMFSKKTNVEFAQVIKESEIKLRVWERGAGETLACGTGACATVAAANKLGLTGKRVLVRLPGGDLEIEILNDSILMTGPAQEIFTGKIRLP